MRTWIRFFSSISFMFLIFLNISACSTHFFAQNSLQITLVTDGHVVNDLSFNQSAFVGMEKFQREFDAWVKNPKSTAPETLKNKVINIVTSQPVTVEVETLVQSYISAAIIDSFAAVATGFVQHAALVRAQNQDLRFHNAMKFIYVDGDTSNDDVPEANKKLTGLLYRAEQSGFLAAVAAGVWMAANYNFGPVTAYGGKNIAQVVNYMYGFYWGIEWFNNNMAKEPLINWIQCLNPRFTTKDAKKFVFLTPHNTNLHFTNNFEQGSTNSKTLNDIIINKYGAKLIFAVAGGQVEDTISIAKSKGDVKIIGVDTDQAILYPWASEMFLTSALKNIADSVSTALWHSLNRSATGDHHTLEKKELKQLFTKNALAKGGTGFTGIANNDKINRFYDLLMTYFDESDHLRVLSQGWDQVVAADGLDLWALGLKQNPLL